MKGSQKHPRLDISKAECLLPGNLVLCTNSEETYVVHPMDELIASRVRLPRQGHLNKEGYEVWLDEEAEEFAEARRGYYPATLMFRDGHHSLMRLHAVDPYIPASYYWVENKKLHQARPFDPEVGWKVGDKVDVCRWEWQDNCQPIWCVGTIIHAEKDGPLYSIEYERPLRFKTEIKGRGGWRNYGKPKVVDVEDNVVFSRLRRHK